MNPNPLELCATPPHFFSCHQAGDLCHTKQHWLQVIQGPSFQSLSCLDVKTLLQSTRQKPACHIYLFVTFQNLGTPPKIIV